MGARPPAVRSAEKLGKAGPATPLLELVGVFPLVAVAVVLGALIRVGQDLVSGVDGLEPFGGCIVPRVHVGMVLAGQPAVRLTDLFFVGGVRYAQYVIVIGHFGKLSHWHVAIDIIHQDAFLVNNLMT